MEKKKSVADAIYEELLQKILTGQYPVGQKLPSELELKEQFSASRNTIRTVLSKMNALGILETRHGGGTVVKSKGDNSYLDTFIPATLLSAMDLLDVIELRKGIETTSAYLAAQNATPQDLARIKGALKAMDACRDKENYARESIAFHIFVAGASKNELFVKLLELIKHISTSRMEEFLYYSGVDRDSAFYHWMIYESIKAKKPDEASFMMQQHMNTLLRRVKAYIAETEKA